jgi:hypothetical protein
VLRFGPEPQVDPRDSGEVDDGPSWWMPDVLEQGDKRAECCGEDCSPISRDSLLTRIVTSWWAQTTSGPNTRTSAAQCTRTGWSEGQRPIARLRSAIAARHVSQTSAKSLG